MYNDIDWSNKDIIKDYFIYSIKELQTRYNLPKHFIVKKVTELGLKKRKDYWTKDEIEQAKKGIVPKNRTLHQYNVYRAKNELTKTSIDRIIWMDEEVEFIKNNYMLLDDKEIAKALNRQPGSVKNKRIQLRLILDRTWTQDEIEILKNCLDLSEAVERLGTRTEYSIKHMCIRHKISFGKRFSYPHQKLCKILKSMSINYINEKRLGKYCIDCFIPNLNICIEVDGTYWHKGKEKRDLQKDEYIKSLDYKIIRIPEKEIDNKSYIIKEISKNIVNCWKTLTSNVEGNQQPSQTSNRLEGPTTKTNNLNADYEVCRDQEISKRDASRTDDDIV
jgi:very-short-patch-repair endonuclease